MSKLAAVLFVLASLAPAALRGPCDVKVTERKTWCPKCSAFVPRADVKGGACPKDKASVNQIEVCVKSVYVAKCHPTTTGLKPVVCCGITYDKAVEDIAKVVWVCAGCPEKSFSRDYKHADSCANRKVSKACEKSGTSPHGTAGK
jgi:hypothetical protein